MKTFGVGRTKGFTGQRCPALPGEGAAVGTSVSGGEPAANTSRFHKQPISSPVAAVAPINVRVCFKSFFFLFQAKRMNADAVKMFLNLPGC